ncbi:MAG: hypothetical protein HY426_01590 [Candidatus Levybacteria bacterium]|nr:hypothetical protein [Candidatus Levybacteria bacterium]
MNKTQSGQAVVALLFFMTISIAIITAIVIIVLNNATAVSSLEQGNTAYLAAESGAENALIRLLRDPSYSGETLIVDQGSVVVEVSNGIVTSTATVANSIRKIQIDTVYNNNVLEVTSWKEIK